MRILGISHIDSGCGYHRVVLPLAFMDDIEGYVTNIPTPEVMAQGWDLFMFNRVSPFDKDLNLVRKELNAKVIVDMDDDWQLPRSHIAWANYEYLKGRLESNITNADLVTCTNERLYDKLIKLNSNVHIFPNALPYGVDQFTDEKTESEFIRIFWCGSITHEYDLSIVRNPIRRLNDSRIQMVIGGYNASNELSRTIWDRMVNYFTNNKKLNYKILDGCMPNVYMEMYKEADIMLIPLENSSWHACKSNLKILEAATKRIPVIVSRVEPYSADRDAPVLWVDRQGDWLKHLNFLINNKNARQDYGEKIYEWARKKYSLQSTNHTRRGVFQNLITA